MITEIKVVEVKGTNIPDMDSIKPVQGQEPQESIKFDVMDEKHATNGPTKGELNHTEANNFPKNAADEWPEPQQIHAFYFVKFRSYDDPKIKTKIEQIEKEIQRTKESRFRVIDSLKAKRSERSGVISQLKPLTAEGRSYRVMIDEKRKEMVPFQAALDKLRTVENARKSEGLCSSLEELDERIRSLHFRLQHESNTIAEEKQMLKSIKLLEGTRDKVMANVAMQSKIGDSFGQKEEMRGQVKQLGNGLDVVRKDQQVVKAKIKNLEEELKDIDGDIKALELELSVVEEKTNKAFDTLRELRKAHHEMNACFQQNRVLLNNVRELAAKKDVASLEELHNTEVEKFMSQWSSSKAFRDDYERRILPSLDSRQLSRDGRMRNPDEKPIISVVATPAVVPAEPEPAKGSTERPKENIKQPALQDTTVSRRKTLKEDSDKSNEPEPRGKTGVVEDKEKSSVPEISKKESSANNEIDAAKLKEMKKAEEIAKAKQALERKRKLAEKAAAKAAAKAQKEAEKKLKEKEKKARKKAEASAPAPVEQEEAEANTEEPEVPEIPKEAPVSFKPKEQKDANIRYRNRQKGSNQLPKVILNRKKSLSYWVWAAPAVAIALAMAMIAFYYSYGKN